MQSLSLLHSGHCPPSWGRRCRAAADEGAHAASCSGLALLHAIGGGVEQCGDACGLGATPLPVPCEQAVLDALDRLADRGRCLRLDQRARTVLGTCERGIQCIAVFIGVAAPGSVDLVALAAPLQIGFYQSVGFQLRQGRIDRTGCWARIGLRTARRSAASTRSRGVVVGRSVPAVAGADRHAPTAASARYRPAHPAQVGGDGRSASLFDRSNPVETIGRRDGHRKRPAVA